MLFRYVVLAGICLTAVGCQNIDGVTRPASSTTEAPGKRITLTESQREKIKVGMAGALKDPYSVVYGPMLAVERTWQGQNEVVICGMINAKNSFGGYIGYKPFIGKIVGDGPFQPIVLGDTTANAPLLVGGACRGAGLPILDEPISSSPAI